MRLSWEGDTADGRLPCTPAGTLAEGSGQERRTDGRENRLNLEKNPKQTNQKKRVKSWVSCWEKNKSSVHNIRKNQMEQFELNQTAVAPVLHIWIWSLPMCLQCDPTTPSVATTIVKRKLNETPLLYKTGSQLQVNCYWIRHGPMRGPSELLKKRKEKKKTCWTWSNSP